jgi:rare lipoprotein A (peptidoglycan hydrolase)
MMIRLLVACAFASAAVMPTSAQDTTAMRLRADSLRTVWSIQWKRSDSLRVESMFARMRSDSLRRAIDAIRRAAPSPSDDSLILSQLRQQAAVRNALVMVQGGKVAAGKTVSDSLTRTTLMEECEEGVASFYADQFHGKRTSSGEVYDMHAFTCAHRWLPFGTLVRVTNLRNGRQCVVRVTDRGPWKHERLIDLSKGAAVMLDFVRSGTTTVRIEVETSSRED